MMKLYYCKWEDSDIEKTLQLLKHISEDRTRRIAKYHCKEDKVRSILGELLLKNALKEDHKDFVQPYMNAYGKPYINGVFFSISHSENIVVVGYGDSEVGVDIERVQDHMEIIDTIFTSYEKQLVFCKTGRERLERFVQMWTMKESLLKMKGMGLCTDVMEYEIMTKGLYFGAKISNADTDLCVISKKIEKDYYLAVCSNDRVIDLIPYTVSNIVESLA